MTLLLTIALAADQEREQVERPPALQPEAGCSLWRGTAAGNDPSTLLELEICGPGGALTGRLQWSSTTSGHNTRTVRGSLDASTVTLADVAMPVSAPAPGWRFCTIDQYTLARTSPDALDGHYASRSCNDRAEVHLTRVSGTLPEPGDPGALPPLPPASGLCMVAPVPFGLWLLGLLALRRRD
ncbi:MAG: hypothetical protein KC621_05230 [Myxococcales bacterium]|nr:hypothetical protein [Myxococcales bacterium]